MRFRLTGPTCGHKQKPYLGDLSSDGLQTLSAAPIKKLQLPQTTPDAAHEVGVVDAINKHLDYANRFFQKWKDGIRLRSKDPTIGDDMNEQGIILEGNSYLIRAGNLLRWATFDSNAYRKKVGSLDTIARDAEYYLLARWKSSTAMIGNAPGDPIRNQADRPSITQTLKSDAYWMLAPFAWDASKGILQYAAALFRRMGNDELADEIESYRRSHMQSDPNQPNSPPGGFVWAIKGLKRGATEDGYAYVTEIHPIMLSD